MDIGTTLAEARLKRGLSLRDVASATKISVYHLEAIERNDFTRLPPGLFRRAYLRAFAAQVGLNPEQIVRAYLLESESESPEQPLTLSTPVVAEDARTVRWQRAVVLAGGLAFVIYGLSVSRSTAPSALPGVDEVPEGQTHVSEDIAPASTTADPATVTSGIQLEIEPRGECWISATVDGQLVLYQLMQAGERAALEARDDIVLRVGDAGAFVYWLNGHPGRQLGGPGEPVTIHITEDNFENFLTETKPSAQT